MNQSDPKHADDTVDELDNILDGIYTDYSDMGFEKTTKAEAKAALSQHYLKEALEIVEQTKSRWREGEELLVAAELRTKLLERWGKRG